MEWTKNLPDKAGYYWIKNISWNNELAEIVKIIMVDNKPHISNDSDFYSFNEMKNIFNFDLKNHLWAGPILLPKGEDQISFYDEML